jgi:hypothetical protein
MNDTDFCFRSPNEYLSSYLTLNIIDFDHTYNVSALFLLKTSPQ